MSTWCPDKEEHIWKAVAPGKEVCTRCHELRENKLVEHPLEEFKFDPEK